MAASDVDNLKSTRRLQAHRIAQKLRLQPLNYVDKSVVIQNEWEKIGLAKRVNMIGKDHQFNKHKRENERRQFVIEKRRLLKPVFDGSIPTSGSILDTLPAYDPHPQTEPDADGIHKQATSSNIACADETAQDGGAQRETDADDAKPEAGDDVTAGSAFPDMDSELLRIVEYFEIHKPNAVKRIHTFKHLDLNEEKQMRVDKLRAKQSRLNRIGTVESKLAATPVTPRIDVHVPTGSQTHRGDFTDNEREGGLRGKEIIPSSSAGFYLSTGRQPTDFNASIDSVHNANKMLLGESYGSSQLNSSTNTLYRHDVRAAFEDDDDALYPITTPTPQPGRHGSLVPLHIVPPTGPLVHSMITPDKRFQSPPSTKKFRNYKVRTSMSDRGKLHMPTADNSLAPTPIARKGKSVTPFGDDARHRQPIDSADAFGTSDADFKAALTESNLKLYAMRQHKPGRRTPRPEPRRGLVTPSMATSLENLTIDEYETAAQQKHHRKPPHFPRNRSRQREDDSVANPFLDQSNAGDAANEYGAMNEHTRAVHETIPERTKRTRSKLFKSKRYGDAYLVPSDVKRTCHDVPFDPYVLAIHKKEIDEIETRKRLEDIKEKLNQQRQSTQSIQNNVNDWMKTVDHQTRARQAKNKLKNRESWSNFN